MNLGKLLVVVKIDGTKLDVKGKDLSRGHRQPRCTVSMERKRRNPNQLLDALIL